MITHNPEIAAQADRTIRIEDGRIHTDSSAQNASQPEQEPSPSEQELSQSAHNVSQKEGR